MEKLYPLLLNYKSTSLKIALLFYIGILSQPVLGQAVGVAESCNAGSVTYRVNSRENSDVFWYDGPEGPMIASGYSFTTTNLSKQYYYSSIQTYSFLTAVSLLRFAKPNATFTVPQLNCVNTPITMTGDACQGNTFKSTSSSGVYSATGAFPTKKIDSLTMMAWVKWDGQTPGGVSQCIMLNGNSASSGYALYIDGASKKLAILLGGVALLKSEKILTTNKWQHVAIVRKEGVWTLYVDGENFTVTNETATPNVPGAYGGGRFSIGKNNVQTDGFTGEIDEVAIWNRALKIKEVNDLRAAVCVSKQGSDGNWNFNEESGTVVNDVSPNGFNLSLTDGSARGAGTTYQWDFGDGSPVVTTNQKSVTHSYAARGRKTVTLTVTDFTNCPASTSQVISVAGTPSGVTATASATATEICKGHSIDVTASNIPYFVETDFLNNFNGWTLGPDWTQEPHSFSSNLPSLKKGLVIAPDNKIINSAAMMPAFSTVGRKDILVFVSHFLQDNNGTIATIEASTDATNWAVLSTHTDWYPGEIKFKTEVLPLPLEMENQPKVYLRFRYNDTRANDLFNAWYIQSVKVGHAAYTWSSTPAGTNAEEQVIPYIFPQQTTTYSLLATNGCDTQRSNVTVVVKPYPTATISGGGDACLNSKTSRISFKGSGAIGPYTFKYAVLDDHGYRSEETVTTTFGDTVSIPANTSALGKRYYDLISVSTPTSCEALYTRTTVTVTVLQLPRAVIDTKEFFCVGEDAYVDISGANGLGPFSFRVRTPDNEVRVVNEPVGHWIARLYANSSQPGTHVFKVHGVNSANGCSYTYPEGQELTNTVTVKPAASVSVTPSSSMYCYDPVVLTASGVGSFTWSPEAGLNKVTGTVVEATPKEKMAYTVTSYMDGCWASATAVVGFSGITLTEPASASSYLVCPGTAVTLTAPKATTVSEPIFNEDFNTNPFERNWTRTRTATTIDYDNLYWEMKEDNSFALSEFYRIHLGSPFMLVEFGLTNRGARTQTLTSPSFSSLDRTKMMLTLNDAVTIIKSTNSVAKVQLSSDGENWTTISSTTDQRTRITSTTTRTIEIPAQFENQPRVQIRFEVTFENVNGTSPEAYAWWIINNVTVTYDQKVDWSWVQATTAGPILVGNTVAVYPDKPINSYYPVATNYVGCNAVFQMRDIITHSMPALTLGPVEPIPVGREYASVPITTYSGFDKLSILSSGAHPMPGFVTRNYENLTFLPPALPVAVPNVPAGTYDLIMRVTSSTTGCSSDIPFQIVVGSSDSGLSGLTVDVAPPNWNGSPITVSGLIKSVVITATVSDPVATLKINGLPAVSGAATTVPLVSAGMIQIPVTVTAQDHTETTVMVSIRKLSNLDVVGQYIDSEAKVGYSLRRLSTAYLHGAIAKPGVIPGIDHSDKPILRVRRSSDNALLDVGYDGTGVLDTLTLLRFASTDDAFVTIWYDQSGNDVDAFQTTLASQPRIVHGGVIERKNSLPTVYFSGGASQNVFLNTASFQGLNGQFSLYAVSGVKTDYQSNQNGLASKTSGGYPAPFTISGGSFMTGNGTMNTDGITLATPFTSAAPFGVWFFRKDSGAPPLMLAEFNNTFNVSGQTPITGNYADAGTPLVIGSDQQGQSRLNGWISELIVLNQSGSQQVRENQMQVYLKPKIIAFTTESATQLVIQGNNFSGATSVTIGSADLTFQVVSDNKIIANVNTMVSGMVTITTPIGTVSKGFFYGPPPGNALRFDLPHAYVQIENTLYTPDFTLETWIRTSTNSAIGNDPYEGTVLLKAGERGVPNGFLLSMLNNKIVFLDGSANESAFGTINVADGRWHHIAVMRRPGRYARIYVDGVADGEGIVAGTAALTASPFIYLGADPANPNFSFRGDMDELRIWQRALDVADLKALMLQVPSKPYNSNLKNYYAFDVLTGDPTTELQNLAAPDRPGTLFNFDPSGNSWVESYAMVVPTAQPATNITSEGFTANWDAPAVGSLQTYILEISKNPAFPRDVDGYKELQTMPGQTLRNLDPGTAYYCRVFASRGNGDNQGGWSQTMKVTTLLRLELTDLSLSHGVLENSFNSLVQDYNSHVGADINDIKVTASTGEAAVQMQIKINNGTYVDLASNQASAPLPLVTGRNLVSIKITADGVTDPKIYTITIYKAFSPPGNALRFDGVDDHITLNNTTTGNFGTGDFTIELYMRTTQLSAGSILNKRDICNLTSYLDFIVADGKLKFVSCTDNTGKDYKSLVGNAIVSDGRWHHVAVTRAGLVTTLYVDGKTDVTFTGTGIANISNTVAVKIGNNVCENRFAGSMDELRIWDVAKTQAQLDDLRYRPIPSTTPDLSAYYNFDIGVNDTNPVFTDLSSSAKHGTLLNFDPASSRVESYAMVIPVPAAASSVSTTEFTANWSAPAIGTSERYFLDVSTSETFASGNFIQGYEALEVNGITKKVTLPPSNSGRQMAGTTYYYRVTADKTSVSGQGAHSSTMTVVSNPLPVTLISFTGKRMENANLLAWKVADENQFDRYEIERSSDAKNFESIGSVAAKSNDKSGITDYSYSDQIIQNVNFSWMYYRLKMVDLDGSYANSRLIVIDREDFVAPNIYPNPALEAINIRVGVAMLNTKANIYDVSGRLVQTIWISKNDQQVSLKNMASGMYFITFANGSVRRFAKQ